MRRFRKSETGLSGSRAVEPNDFSLAARWRGEIQIQPKQGGINPRIGRTGSAIAPPPAISRVVPTFFAGALTASSELFG